MEYKDHEGYPTTLYKLIRNCPDWAYSRIKAGEEAAARITQLEATVRELTSELTDSVAAGHKLEADKRVLVEALDNAKNIEWFYRGYPDGVEPKSYVSGYNQAIKDIEHAQVKGDK